MSQSFSTVVTPLFTSKSKNVYYCNVYNEQQLGKPDFTRNLTRRFIKASRIVSQLPLL